MTNTNFITRVKTRHNKLVATSSYLIRVTVVLSISLLSTLLINIVLGAVVFNLVEHGQRAGSTDIISLVFALIVGIMFFGTGFKFSVVNGTSRKTYFFSMLIALFITSLAWAVVSTIAVAVGERVGTILSLVTYMYGGLSLASFLWLLTTTYALALLGLFISVIIYRTTRTQKLVMFVGLMALSSILILINILSSGKLLGEIVVLILRAAGCYNKQNAFIGSLSSIVCCVVFACGVYVLVRRASVR